MISDSNNDESDCLKNRENTIANPDIYRKPYIRLRRKSENKIMDYNYDTEKLLVLNANKFKLGLDKKEEQGKKATRRYSSCNKIDRCNILNYIKGTSTNDNTLKTRISDQKSNDIQVTRLPSKKNMRKRRRVKKVRFKPNFVTVIDIESYKEYNLNEYWRDFGDAKCCCLIY